MNARRSMGVLSAILALAWAASPRLPAADAPDSETPVAPGVQREQVHLILIDVVVTDKKGNSVEDLRPDEFSLWVDGKTHAINSVELRRTGEAVPGVPAAPAPTPEAGRPPGEIRPPGAAPVFTLPSPRRFVFFMDGLNSPKGLGPKPVQTVRTFLQKNLLPADEVMVVGLGRELRVYQELTADRGLTLKALDAVEADPGLRAGGQNEAIQNMKQIQDAESMCIRCDAWQRLQAGQRLAVVFADEDRRRIERTLASLRAVITSLNVGKGRKELFYFTDGFPADPDALYGSPGDPRTKADGAAGPSLPAQPTLQSEILQITREAGSAQVAIHTINTQGITAGADMRLEGVSDRTPYEVIESHASNTLAGFALGTGGTATRGTNDFLPALERVDQESRATYVVSYVPTGDPDGLFHATRVEVSRKGVRVRANEGFVWLTEAQSQERKLFAAFMSPELYHDFPLALEAITYLEQGRSPAVEFAIAVPDQMLLFFRKGEEYVARLEAGVALRLGKSQVAEQFSRSVEARLTAPEMASHRPLTLVARRETPPGEYEAVAVVRDLGTGNIGALRIKVKVPALTPEKMAMSSLVLERPDIPGRRVDLEPATEGNASLVIPAAPRVFTRETPVQASCFIYHPRRRAGTGEAEFQVRGIIRKGNVTEKEFPTAVHVFTSDQNVDAIPLRIPLNLADIEPGTYSLQVQVLDRVGKQGVVQSLDFVVR